MKDFWIRLNLIIELLPFSTICLGGIALFLGLLLNNLTTWFLVGAYILNLVRIDLLKSQIRFLLLAQIGLIRLEGYQPLLNKEKVKSPPKESGVPHKNT